MGSAAFIPTKPQFVSGNEMSAAITVTLPALSKEGQVKQSLLRLKEPKKLNRIYGDWLDDMPLLLDQSNQAEL